MEGSVVQGAFGEILCNALEISDSGFAVLDAEDCFLHCNPAYVRMFGLDGLSIIGNPYLGVLTAMYEKHLADRWVEPQEEWLGRVMTQHRSETTRSFEIDTADGRRLLVSEMVCPGGELAQHSTDITHIRRTEQSLLDAKAALERLSLADELTGLANRRHFLQVLERELARVSRHGQALTLAVLELDFFGQIVDCHGAAASERVLQHFASLLQEFLRKTDMAGRVGNSEFAVLLPHTQRQDAVNIFRRLGDKLSALTLADVASGFSYSFSGGVVTTEARFPVSTDWVLGCAEKALAQARSSGRRCVMPYLG